MQLPCIILHVLAEVILVGEGPSLDGQLFASVPSRGPTDGPFFQTLLSPGGTEPSQLISQERALPTGPGTPQVAENLHPASGKATPQPGVPASWLQGSGCKEVCFSLMMTYLGKEKSSAYAKGIRIAGGCVQDRLHGFPAE